MSSISQLDIYFNTNYSSDTQLQLQSFHTLQHVKFSKGEDLSNYFAKIQKNAETNASFFASLSLIDHQSILILILNHWIAYKDNDYIKLFIQVLPYYLTAIEKNACENFVKSYLPSLPCITEKDKLQIDTTPTLRCCSDEFECVKSLLLHFGIPAIPDCPMGTFSYSLKKWMNCQNPQKLHATSMLTKFLHITEDWNADPTKKDRAKTAFDLSCTILSLIKESEVWFGIFHANKATPLQYLTATQIESYYKTAKSYRSFHIKGYQSLFKKLTAQNVSLACAVSQGLEAHEIARMLIQFTRKEELSEGDIQGIKDILALPWKLKNDNTIPLLSQLETIKALAEKTSAHKYILLHKIHDKTEEIAATRRIFVIKELSRV